MGTTTVTRQHPACSEAQLREYFSDQLDEMAREGGSGSYCGNWNANTGLHITSKQFASVKEAEAYCERICDKNGSVIAVKVGDFSKSWPETKAQKTLVARVGELEKEMREFEYRILERAHKQKTKKKTCSHCDSNINVHAIRLPKLSELTEDCGRISINSGNINFMGRFLRAMHVGLTDCPVCNKNLLVTETDTKNKESLQRRLKETREKASTEEAAYKKAKAGKPQAYWYLHADCGC